MKEFIRVVECGGRGFRSADVCGEEVVQVNEAPASAISTPASLLNFAFDKLAENTIATIFPVAGIVENHKTVVRCPNIPFFSNLNLGDWASGWSGIPTFVVNDMESSVTGSAKIFPHLSYFMNMTWSSGIGARTWKDGKIISDSEIGHTSYDRSPLAPLCGCKKRGCFEAYTGGIATTSRIITECKVAGRKIPENMRPCQFLDFEFKRGREWAIDLYDRILEVMAIFLSGIQTSQRLPAIVWKGSFALAVFADLKLGQNLKEKMLRYTMVSEWVDDLDFLWDDPANIENRDSFIGASIIAQQLLGQK